MTYCHRCVYEAIRLRTQMQILRQNRSKKRDFEINAQINRFTVRHEKAVQTSKQIQQVINRQQVKTRVAAIRQKIRNRKTGEQVQMAGTQVHNIDNMANWQR